MTKVTILGQEPTEQKELKPIEFLEECGCHTWVSTDSEPDEWDNIELIAKGFSAYDLMFAYDDNDRSNGVLYLGYFNDGIVK